MENIEKMFGKWKWDNKQNANMVGLPISKPRNTNTCTQTKKPDGYKSSQSSSLKFV